LKNKTCINPILLLYYNFLGLYFVFVVDGRKGGLVGKRAVESIRRRQFSNRIDLNAIVARRHTGTLDQNSFQSPNNPAQGIAWILKETKKDEKFDYRSRELKSRGSYKNLYISLDFNVLKKPENANCSS
jgi:hypothetical protein